jgi:aminoglycoside phosphotransferase
MSRARNLNLLLSALGVERPPTNVVSSPFSLVLKADGREGSYGIKASASPQSARWECDSLAFLAAHGLPTPQIVAVADTNRGVALFAYEWVESMRDAQLASSEHSENIMELLRSLSRVSTLRLPNVRRYIVEDVAKSRRPPYDKAVLQQWLSRTLSPNERADVALHGDFWADNLVASKTGCLVAIDLRVQKGPWGLDLVSYGFYAGSLSPSDPIMAELDALSWRARMLGTVRELARSPEAPLAPWLEWALNGGLLPEDSSSNVGVA